MFIVIVVIFSFGISIQSLLFPNQELNWTVFGNIFLPSFFTISGENLGLTDTILGVFQVGLSSKQFKKAYNLFNTLKHRTRL
jgi:hypothetical protein